MTSVFSSAHELFEATEEDVRDRFGRFGLEDDEGMVTAALKEAQITQPSASYVHYGKHL